MGRYKVAVYAICKNESAHAARFMASMGEADSVYVLDTGSSDHSPRCLRALGAVVQETVINPWRFDTARNLALDMVPQDVDICVCCDLDEVFDPGWRQALEDCWQEGINRVSYPFYYDGQGSFFHRSLIHARQGFVWQWPIHEALMAQVAESVIFCPNITLRHFPDPTKSRKSYLPMLEQAVSESPKDARMLRYLGREYLMTGDLDKAEPILWRHVLFEPWDAQKAASLHDLAAIRWRQNQPAQAEMLYRCAARTCPRLRESYVELCRLCLSQNRPADALEYIDAALAIGEPDPSYFNAWYAWSALPEMLRQEALHLLKRQQKTAED